MKKIKYGVLVRIQKKSHWSDKKEWIGKLFRYENLHIFSNENLLKGYYAGYIHFMNKRSNPSADGFLVPIIGGESWINIAGFKFRKPTQDDWDRLLVEDI